MKIILTIPDNQLNFVMFEIMNATEGINKSIQVLPDTCHITIQEVPDSHIPEVLEGPQGTVVPCDEGLSPTITIHRKLAEHQQRSLHQKVNL